MGTMALSGHAGMSTWHRPLAQPSPPWQSSDVRHKPGCMQLPSMQNGQPTGPGAPVQVPKLDAVVLVAQVYVTAVPPWHAVGPA